MIPDILRVHSALGTQGYTLAEVPIGTQKPGKAVGLYRSRAGKHHWLIQADGKFHLVPARLPVGPTRLVPYTEGSDA